MVKTKALISCKAAEKLICAFVLAYATRRFSYDINCSVLNWLYLRISQRNMINTQLYKGRFDVVKLTWRCNHVAYLCLLI